MGGSARSDLSKRKLDNLSVPQKENYVSLNSVPAFDSRYTVIENEV
jgi:hypothetical protein